MPAARPLRLASSFAGGALGSEAPRRAPLTASQLGPPTIITLVAASVVVVGGVVGVARRSTVVAAATAREGRALRRSRIATLGTWRRPPRAKIPIRRK
jgi:hypothetical protein